VTASPNRIAVSGTGIAGLAAACSVLAAGHPCLLVGPPPNPVAGGLQLAPNGWAALRVLGLDEAVQAKATRLEEIVIRKLGNGATLTRMPLPAHYASLARADLSAILTANLTGQASLDRLESAIVKISHAGETLAIIDQDGGLHHSHALVAADGARGFGRTHVTGETPGLQAGRRLAVRSEVPSAKLPDSFLLPASNLWFGEGVHIVHYPIKDRVNIVVSMARSDLSEGWQSVLFGPGSPLRPLADPSISWFSSPLPHAGSSPCWRRGRVVLAGDAAHIMPPHLAQGAGQSLQDAAQLRLALEENSDIEAALKHYARHRASTVAEVTQKAEISGKVMQLGGVAGRIRNIAFDLGGEALLRNWLAEVWAADPALARAG